MENLRRAAASIANRSLFMAWNGWHQMYCEILEAKEMMKKSMMALINNKLFRALEGWRDVCDARNAQMELMRKAGASMLHAALAKAFGTWLDKYHRDNRDVDGVAKKLMARLIHREIFTAFSMWREGCHRIRVTTVGRQSALKLLRASLWRVDSGVLQNMIKSWQMNLLVTRSRQQLKKSSDAAGQGLIKVLRAKESDLQLATRNTAGIYLIRDLWNRTRERKCLRQVQIWRRNMSRLTQRVLHDSILMQETLEVVGRKLWLRCVRDTTKRWYRDALFTVAGQAVRNWVVNLQLAIQQIDISTFQLMNNAHMLQNYRAGAYHLGKAILRWRNKNIQALVRQWKKNQGHFVSYLLRETLWLHEEAEKVGRSLWVRCLLEVCKRWQYQSAVRMVGVWRINQMAHAEDEKIQELNAVQGLKMMNKIMKAWNSTRLGRRLYMMKRNYLGALADETLGNSNKMKAELVRMQEEELLSRVKKLGMKTYEIQELERKK